MNPPEAHSSLRPLPPVAVLVGVAVVLCVLSAVTDGAILFWYGATAGAQVFALGANLCMACLLTVLAGSAGLVCRFTCIVIHQRVPRGAILWPLLLYGVLAGVCWWVADVLEQAHPWWYAGVVTVVAALVLLNCVVAFTSLAWLRRWVVWPMALVALAVDANPPSQVSPALHNLLGLVSATSWVALGLPWCGAWAGHVPAWSAGVVLAVGLGSVPLWNGMLTGGDLWRLDAERRAVWQPRLASVFRALVDVDRDGFSPVAWGGDCDDRDAKRHPMALDAPGDGDQNCNGVDPPQHPRPQMLGLTEAFGDPALPTGAVDLVLVITVEALRSDAFQFPGVMPTVREWGTRGLQFTRMYAAGTRTRATLTLAQRGKLGEKPLGTRLGQAAITSTFIMSIHWPVLQGLMQGFTRTYEPPDGRWDGATVTHVALTDLREHAKQPHLLWVHYADSHEPYTPPSSLPDVPIPPGTSKPFADYLRCLRVIDGEIARLLAGVRETHDPHRVAVLILSDHGEGFGEHGVWQHSAGTFEAMVRVPALLVGPGIPPAVHDGLTSQRDVAPTILGAFGLADEVVATEWAGRSWWRLRSAPSAPLHSFTITYSTRKAAPLVALSPEIVLVRGHHKLTVAIADRAVHLYDLHTDTQEQHNLLLEEPALQASMRAELELFRDLEGAFGWGAPPF